MADNYQDEKPASTKDKLKHPFHELKEKLEGTHLHNLKVNLTHQKYGLPSHLPVAIAIRSRY